MITQNKIKLLVTAAAVLTLSACTTMEKSMDKAMDKTKTMMDAPKADIVDTAIAAGSFNTLVAAVQAAGLVDTLKGDGPFTVFAPTDETFSALPN